MNYTRSALILQDSFSSGWPQLRGEAVVRKKLSRRQLLQFTANLHVDLIGMEACGGAHFLGAHCAHKAQVRLMPAQYVKPYVKTNKNDYIDAKQSRRRGKTNNAFRADQDDDSWICSRCTGCVNAGSCVARLSSTNTWLAARSGITLRRATVCRRSFARHFGRCRLEAIRCIACVACTTEAGTRSDGDTDDEADAVLNKTAHENEACQRLVEIPHRPVTATALIAASATGRPSVRDGVRGWMGVFHGALNRRQAETAWISKHGIPTCEDCSYKCRAVLQQRTKQTRPECLASPTYDPCSQNVVAVALANKLARIAWACSQRRNNTDLSLDQPGGSLTGLQMTPG